MAKRNRTMRKHGGFRFSFARDPTQRTLNPLTWFQSYNTSAAPATETIVNSNEPIRVVVNDRKPNARTEVPNTVSAEDIALEMGPVPEKVVVDRPPNLPPGTPGYKLDGGRRRKRTARKSRRRSARKSRRSAKRKH